MIYILHIYELVWLIFLFFSLLRQSPCFLHRTLMANIPVITVLFSLSWVAGMVIFASYADCDPLRLGYISKIDEIVPFYVEDKFVFLPGLLGLFMASLFNGALRYVLQSASGVRNCTIMQETHFQMHTL